jgi:hypothetical protein
LPERVDGKDFSCVFFLKKNSEAREALTRSFLIGKLPAPVQPIAHE